MRNYFVTNMIDHPSDIPVYEAALRRYENSRKRGQASHTCNVCGIEFDSGNKLFKHLNIYTNHQVNYHEMWFELRCKCGEITDPNSHWLNRKLSCNKCKTGIMLPYRVHATPYYRKELEYIVELDTNL